MKKSMTNYIKVLSDGDYDILEEIIINKYNEFLQLYWLINNFNDYITSLSYKESKKEVLKVNLTIPKKTNKILTELASLVPEDNNNIHLWNEDNVIYIEISKTNPVVG